MILGQSVCAQGDPAARGGTAADTRAWYNACVAERQAAQFHPMAQTLTQVGPFAWAWNFAVAYKWWLIGGALGLAVLVRHKRKRRAP